MLLGLARKGSETSSEMKSDEDRVWTIAGPEGCGRSVTQSGPAVPGRPLRYRCRYTTLAATAAEHMHLFDIVAVVDDDDDDAIANSWSPRSAAPLGRAR